MNIFRRKDSPTTLVCLYLLEPSSWRVTNDHLILLLAIWLSGWLIKIRLPKLIPLTAPKLSLHHSSRCWDISPCHSLCLPTNLYIHHHRIYNMNKNMQMQTQLGTISAKFRRATLKIDFRLQTLRTLTMDGRKLLALKLSATATSAGAARSTATLLCWPLLTVASSCQGLPVSQTHLIFTRLLHPVQIVVTCVAAPLQRTLRPSSSRRAGRSSAEE